MDALVDRQSVTHVDRHSRQRGTNNLFSCLTSNLVLMIYSLTNLRLNITGDSEIYVWGRYLMILVCYMISILKKNVFKDKKGLSSQ